MNIDHTICIQIADEESKKKTKPLQVKKLYTLAAQLVQEHNSNMKQVMKNGKLKNHARN